MSTQTRVVRVPLDGLGMDEKAMLELVNRMNQNDDRKWVFEQGQCSYGYQGQLNNQAIQALGYQQQAINPFLQ
jgi:Holliday junction resolvasome RuvABC DNA-binding subunit